MHDLRLGVLEQRAGDGREVARAVLARVQPADHGAAGERAAVEVRHEPGGGAQQRRLARPPTGPRARRTRPARRRARRRAAAAPRAGIGVGDALEAQSTRSWRRSPGGRRAAQRARATSAAQSAATRRADRRAQARVGVERRGPPASAATTSARRAPTPRRRSARSWRDHGAAAARRAGAAHRRSRGPRASPPRRARGPARRRRPRARTARRGAARAGAAAPRLREAPRVARPAPGPAAWRASRSAPSGTRARRKARSRPSGSTAAAKKREAADHDDHAQAEQPAVRPALRRSGRPGRTAGLSPSRANTFRPSRTTSMLTKASTSTAGASRRERATSRPTPRRPRRRPRERRGEGDETIGCTTPASVAPATQQSGRRPWRGRRAAGWRGARTRASALRRAQRLALVGHEREAVAQDPLLQRLRRVGEAAASVPVTTQTGLPWSKLVAATRPVPGAERPRHVAAGVEQRERLPVGAMPREHAADLRTAARSAWPPGRSRIAGHGPTRIRSVSFVKLAARPPRAATTRRPCRAGR